MLKENKGAYSHLKLGKLTTDKWGYVNFVCIGYR